MLQPEDVTTSPPAEEAVLGIQSRAHHSPGNDQPGGRYQEGSYVTPPKASVGGGVL